MAIAGNHLVAGARACPERNRRAVHRAQFGGISRPRHMEGDPSTVIE